MQQIIRSVNIPVPIDFAKKDTKRTVANCIEAITRAVDLHDKAGTLILDSQQQQDLSNVNVLAIIGNFVSHYETGSGSSLSAPVLSGVITSIEVLADYFMYQDSVGGNTVRKWYRSLSSR